VDRPEGVSLATPDGLGPPPFAGFRLFAGRDARPPVAARDHRGRDVTGRLVAVDGRYPDGFRPIAFQGFAEDHSVTLRFAPPEDRRRAFLLVTGGYYWSEADGYAVSQARRITPRPPRLEVRTAQGWRTVLDPMPFPGGRPKTVAVDLAGLLPPGDGPVELRISSNLRLYFDRILLATDRGDELPLHVRPLGGTAALRRRGYSAPLPWDGRVPQSYDYDRTVPGRPFPRFQGFYTRFGDVTPLLAETDGELVVLHHGEEVALELEAPEPPPGFRRDFLLHLVGWDKDGDPKIAGGARVEPLPFVGMESYPYHWPERYPWTPEALAADRATRTRWIPGSSPWR